MKLSFIGAAQEVTGSCFLVETAGLRFLVDCGMFQGGREARERNLKRLALPPGRHRLRAAHARPHRPQRPAAAAVRAGLQGPHLHHHRHGRPADGDAAGQRLHPGKRLVTRAAPCRHAGATPRREFELLYTVAQAEACLDQVQGVAYDADAAAAPRVRCRFRDAGHILGSAILEVWISEAGRTRKIVFSGDLGQPGRPIVRDPTPIGQADVLVVESTYGDRLHRPLQETIDELVLVIEDTLRRRQGNIIIPAFALGRTQEMLFLLADLRRQGRLPPMQVFVDSPMADRVTEITARHPEFLDDETRAVLSPAAGAAGGAERCASRRA
jgi:metallo-beta-lactamase family protein